MRTYDHIRSTLRRPRRLQPAAVLLIAASLLGYLGSSERAVADPPPGSPVITSFALTELYSGYWRLSGTVTASEGLEGMVLYFGGSVVDETDEPEMDGTFSIDVAAEPIEGDWATVYAVDRWEMHSNHETEYFF